ncbi:MAG: hypothetical protein E7374_01635 [Clostridiales bacterium]|nr:hypothetical protein [Clostridiales bacterium]
MLNFKIQENLICSKQIQEKVCDFLKVSHETKDNMPESVVREIVECKLKSVLGEFQKHASKEFLTFLTGVIGQSVCDILNINVRMVNDEFRLLRTENFNIVESSKFILETEDLEEGLLDSFLMIDKFWNELVC